MESLSLQLTVKSLWFAQPAIQFSLPGMLSHCDRTLYGDRRKQNQ